MLFGRSRDEVLGQALGTTARAPTRLCTDFAWTDSSGRRAAAARKLVELCALDRDAREIPIEMTVWIVSDDDCHTFNAFIRDLTKRSEIETALRDTARLQTTGRRVRDVIILTTQRHHRLHIAVRPKRPRLRIRRSSNGHNLDEFVHAEDREAFARTLDRAIEGGGEIAKHTNVHARRWPRSGWISHVGGSRRRDGSHHRPRNRLSRITRRSSLRKPVSAPPPCWHATQSGLRAAVAHEQELVEKLQKMDRLKDRLVSMVSQSFATPLTSIAAMSRCWSIRPSVRLPTGSGPCSDVVERKHQKAPHE